jgi:hypothetical protein
MAALIFLLVWELSVFFTASLCSKAIRRAPQRHIPLGSATLITALNPRPRAGNPLKIKWLRADYLQGWFGRRVALYLLSPAIEAIVAR